MTRPRPGWLLALAFALLPRTASAGAPTPLVAKQITTVMEAADLLFGGTDADGGMDDWYLSNGVVQVVIDDVGEQEDLADLGVTPVPPKQSEAGFTGGTVIDLGRVGENNDQLAQMFTVGGLSTSNFFVFNDIVALPTTPTTATIRVSGGVLGFAVPPDELEVVTDYSLGLGDDFLTITTTITNGGAVDAMNLGQILDVFIWTEKGPLPFSPLPGLGFDHPVLVLASPAAAIEQPPFSAAPGSAGGPSDGVIDPNTGEIGGEVSYGVLGVRGIRDIDGPGPTAPSHDLSLDTLFGVSNHDLTALGALVCFPCPLPPDGTLTYTRRIYVGTRKDVASVANPMLEELGTRTGTGFETGTISGDVDAAESADLVVTGIATRTGGAALTSFPDGTPVTQFRTDGSGAFSGVVLPVGTYDLEVRAPERDPVMVSGISVAAGADTGVTVPPLSALGTVEIQVFEKRKGPDLAIPAKATFKGRKGDPDPILAREVHVRELTADPDDDETVPTESYGGSLAQGNLVYLPDGTGSVQLRPGRYEVYGSRGPEYTVQRKKVTVKPGKTKRLKFVLSKLLDTPDAISGDFHIHSARSLDSSAGLPARVASFAGEGLEVMVSTDHDFHLDYAPVIQDLELERFITSIIGVEVTGSVPNPPAFPDSTGHINGWPMMVDATARRDGSIEDEFVAPNMIFKRLRDAGADVIQYNHLRAGSSGLTSIGFFNNMGCGRCENDIDQTCSVDADCPGTPDVQNCTCVGYQPDRVITDVPNVELLDDDVTGNSGVPNPDPIRNIDFDAMEIGNGISPMGYLRLRADWFSLLAQASESGPVPIIWGTGVSDSHRISIEAAGYMRTYVLGSGDDPMTLDKSGFDTNILAGRMMATTGPFIEMTLADGAGNTAGLGETFHPSASPLTLRVRVQASSWIPVEEVRVVVNGDVPVGLAFDESTTPEVEKAPKPLSKSKKKVVRFDAEIPLPESATDFFVLAEAGQKLDPVPAADPFASVIVPDFVSLSFTNPIFVDLAGDGFNPPGLPPGGFARATAPLRTEAGRAAERAEAEAYRHIPFHALRIPEEAARKALEREGR